MGDENNPRPPYDPAEKWRVIMDGLKYLADKAVVMFNIAWKIAVIVGSIVTMWVALQNSRIDTKIEKQGEKIDTAAVASVVAAEAAGEAVQVAVNTKANTDQKLTDIGSKLDVGVAAAVSTNAINTKWVADKSGDPVDKAKAEAAEKRLEAVAPPP